MMLGEKMKRAVTLANQAQALLCKVSDIIDEVEEMDGYDSLMCEIMRDIDNARWYIFNKCYTDKKDYEPNE